MYAIFNQVVDVKKNQLINELPVAAQTLICSPT